MTIFPLLIRLLYESAMRVGELLALWVEDIHLAENRIQVRDRGSLENGAEIKTGQALAYPEVDSLFKGECLDTGYRLRQK